MLAKVFRVNAIGPEATSAPINQDWIDEERKGDVYDGLRLCGKSHSGCAGSSEEMAAAVAF